MATAELPFEGKTVRALVNLNKERAFKFFEGTPFTKDDTAEANRCASCRMLHGSARPPEDRDHCLQRCRIDQFVSADGLCSCGIPGLPPRWLFNSEF